MRKRWVIGNWKMNGDTAFAKEWAAGIETGDLANVEIGVCPPFSLIAPVKDLLANSKAVIGAQNVAATEKGAFTGEVSALMLKDIGARIALVGHSERRALFAERNEQVKQKCEQLLRQNITPVVCVGETQEQREAETTSTVIAEQLKPVLELLQEHTAEIMVAYEPVWAIGTGLTATPEQAQEVHAYIRSQLAKINKDVAENTSILYGGSVNRDNAAALFAEKDIDGGLIGGASLDAEHFLTICKALNSQ